MKPNARPSLVVCVIASIAFIACEGSGLVKPIDKSATHEVPQDTTGEGVEVIGDGLDFWFLTANGAKGANLDAVDLARADEPLDYVATPNFQMNIQVSARDAQAGTQAQLFVDDTAVAVSDLTNVGGVLSATFSAVTLPVRAQGVPVRVKTTGANGSPIVREKLVTVVLSGCTIEAKLAENDASCADTTYSPTAGLAVGVDVTLTDGPCDQATLDVAFGVNTQTLGPIAFDQTGLAHFDVVLAVGAGPDQPEVKGALGITATASVAADPLTGASIEIISKVDTDVAAITLVTPPADGSGTITLDDDVGGDPSNGLQYVVSFKTDATAGDAVLTIDGVEAGTAALPVLLQDSYSFSAVTLNQNGPVAFRVAITNSCGAVGSAQASTLVLSSAGQIGIVRPSDKTVLLARDDGNLGTATVYETSVDVLTTGAQVGATLSVWCAASTLVDPADRVRVGIRTLASGELAPNGRYTIPVALDVVALGTELSCVARVDLPAAAESTPVVLTVALPAPTLTVEAPSDGACVNGTDINVAGSATGLDGENVMLDLGTGALPSTLGAVADGAWSGVARLGTTASDGDYTLGFDAMDALGNVVTDTSGPIVVSVTLDRTVPTIASTTPALALDATLTPDASTTVAGYQTTVRATVTDAHAADGSACLAVGGADSVCVPVAADGSAEWTLVTLAVGPNSLVFTATDTCGNPSAELTRIVTLTQSTPIAIVTPTDGTALLAADDGEPATAQVFEGNVVVDSDGAAAGATVRVQCRVNGAGAVFVDVGSLVVAAVAADGRYTVPVELDTAVLGTDIICQATVDLPFAGVSGSIGLRVGLPAPTLAIAAPTVGACLTAATVDVSGVTSGLDGRPITATLGTGQASANAAAGAYSVTVPVPATDGPATVAVSASDTFGNNVASNVAVLIDRTAPTLVYNGPISPVDTVTSPDADPVTAGYQTTVSATLVDLVALGGQVCLAVNGGAATCADIGDTSGDVTFPGTTLQGGDNALVFTLTDGCGNAGTPVTENVTLSIQAPAVAITTPSADRVTTANTIDLTVTVNAAGGGPLAGAAVTLTASGVATGLTPIDHGDGTYTFAAVPLAPGVATSFVASATAAGGTGASSPRLITQKNVVPTIAISAPAGGMINLATTGCQVGQADCVLTVTATTTNAENTSTASLAVDCDGVAVTYPGTVTADVASFPGVVLTNGATCNLTASVTDAAAQTASSPERTVDVDRSAPVLDITSPSGPLQNTADLSVGTPGIQAPLVVDVAGVEAGQDLDVVLSWVTAGGPQTKSYAAVATGTDGPVAFEEFAGAGWITWPDGFITITVTAQDLAANPATDVATVTVSSTADVRITSPVAVADACAGTCATGVCNAGACWRTWGVADSRQLVASPAGMTTTSQNIRVCSDEPSLAGTGAAVCASTPSATGPYRQVFIGNTSGALTTLDLSGSLPSGFQRLVVEVMPITGGGWISSLGTTNAVERVRRIDVDLGVPTVSALGSPSDTLAPVGTLNAAEQFSAPRVYSISFTPSEAARAEVFVQGASALVQDVTATATTVQVTLPEGTPQVWVVLTDSVGNRSPLNPATGAVTYQPTVDVTAPTLSFSRPNTSPLRGGDNLDVVLTSNAEGRTATVKDGGVDVASGLIVSGAATFADATNHILTDGTHTLTATVSDAAGNPVTAATSPVSIVVDAAPPSGTITDPVELDVFTDADDAAPAPGFQVSVAFTTTGGATSWALLVANGCDATWSGCSAPTQEATGSVTNPDGAEPPQLITVNLEAALTFKKFILRTTDAGGNVATDEVDVSFAVTSCSLAFTNLPSTAWYNVSACPGGTPCASTSVGIDVQLSGACALSELRLLNGGAQVGTIANPVGTETFTLTVADAAHLSLEAKGFAGASEIASTGVRVRDADFTPPSVQFVSQVVNGFTTTAEGASTTYNVANDLLPATSGMQLHAAVRVTDTNAAGGGIASISATGASGTTALTPSNVALPVTLAGASPITQTLLDLALADNDTYTVTVTGADAAGNTDTSTFTAKVDVTAPSEVPIQAITMQQRRPRANQFRWTAVGDDGVTNGAVARYEIRYSFQPIDDNTWGSNCLGTDVWGSNPMPAPAAPGVVQATLMGAPDTRPIADACKLPVFFENSEAPTEIAMYMAIRAVDDAGNWSPLGTQSNRPITNAEIWMRLTRVRFDNTGGSLGLDPNFLTVRGAILGDINGDTRPDWAVGSTNAGGACVILGHAYPVAGETISTPTGTNHTCVTNATIATLIPNATQVGTTVEPLGDINGDGRADFGITGKVASGSPQEGFVLIYFGPAITGGNPTGMPNLAAPNIIVRGVDALTVAYTGVCGAGNFDGTGPADFAIGEPFSNRINVFPGNATWTEATSLTINLDVAGDLAANGGMTINFVGPANAGFGARCGNAGDVLPLVKDAKDDLIVNSTGADNGRVFVFPGRTWVGGDTNTVNQNPAGSAEDLRSLRLRQESDGPQAGFGAGFQGNVDLTNDGIPDVLVTIRARSFDNAAGANHDGKATYIFDGAKLAGLVGGDVRVDIGTNAKVGESWTGTNGWVLYSSVFGDIRSVRAIGDFNQQNVGSPSRPTVDLALANIVGDTVQLRMNHARGGVNALGQFSIIDGLFNNLYNDLANGVGTWIDAGGDLTGDGLIDFIVGSQKGDVLIIR